MQVPTSTLLLVLFSLASAGLGEAKYKPPTTYSPDYKQCRNGVDSDPACVPWTSDESVASLRDKGQRFTLLNQKRPELKAVRQSASRAAASATKAAMEASGRPMAPSLVYPESEMLSVVPDSDSGSIAARAWGWQESEDNHQIEDMSGSMNLVSHPTVSAEEDQDRGEEDATDNTGNAKYGFGSGGWGRPFIKRDSTDFAFPTFSTFPSFPGFPKFPGLTAFGAVTSASPSPAPLPGVTSPPNEVEKVSDLSAVATFSTMDSSVPIVPVAVADPPTVTASPAKDSTGNAKWGFGSGGWGRPWRRNPAPIAGTECMDSTDASPCTDVIASAGEEQATVPASIPSTQATELAPQSPSQEATGNMKWGFGSGGWDRPFARRSAYDAEDQEEEEEGVKGDSTGNAKYGFGLGGWARPYAR